MNAKPLIYLVILAILAVCAYSLFFSGGGGPGELNAISGLPAPKQTELGKNDEEAKIVNIKGYTMNVKFKYKYEIEALVVSAKAYNGFGIQDAISPKDLALAWGDVAALNKDIDFQWDQSGRFASWYIDSGEDLAKLGGVDAVTRQMSNNHIFPATTTVKNDLKKVKMGDHIRIEGYLVDIYGYNKSGATFTWNSSTSREDSGDGACEVIYTTKIEWVP